MYGTEFFPGCVELTTLGMISPAFSITTASPSLMSFLAISASLCRVALDTVVPATSTGSSSATGVSAPVRPTWMVMDLRIVVACSAANL